MFLFSIHILQFFSIMRKQINALKNVGFTHGSSISVVFMALR